MYKVNKACLTILPRMSFLFCLLMLGSVSSASAKTQNEEALLLFIDKRVTDIFELASSEGSYEERLNAFHELINRYVAHRKIAFFLLGPYARSISKTQFLEYTNILGRYLANFYLFKISIYNKDVTFEVSPNIEKRGPGFIIATRVTSSLFRDPFNMSWWVLPKAPKEGDDLFLLFDFSLEGIWIAQEQRVIFTSKLREINGDFEAFFGWLKRALDKRINREKRRLERLSKQKVRH